jgi:hypothetical protein
MKILLLMAIAAVTATCFADSPFACNRAALTAQARKRHFDELSPALRARQKSVRELHDDFEFEFPADAATFQLVLEWVTGERLCCPSSISTCMPGAALDKTHESLDFHSCLVVRLIDLCDQRSKPFPTHEDYRGASK